MRKLTIRMDIVEYDILNQYCWNNHTSPSDVIRKMIREQLDVEDKIPFVSQDLILRISGKTRHSPLFVEKILNKYRGNWELQAQALFRTSPARLATAKCLEDILDDKEPDYDNLAIAISTSTGYRPIQVERVLKRYPLNIELQFLELFRALQPRIEEPGRVSLKIGNNRMGYDLNSLDELAQAVKASLAQTLPTEFDVARLTKLIDNSNQDEMPSDQDFEAWLKNLDVNEEKE